MIKKHLTKMYRYKVTVKGKEYRINMTWTKSLGWKYEVHTHTKMNFTGSNQGERFSSIEKTLEHAEKQIIYTEGLNKATPSPTPQI